MCVCVSVCVFLKLEAKCGHRFVRWEHIASLFTLQHPFLVVGQVSVHHSLLEERCWLWFSLVNVWYKCSVWYIGWTPTTTSFYEKSLASVEHNGITNTIVRSKSKTFQNLLIYKLNMLSVFVANCFFVLLKTFWCVSTILRSYSATTYIPVHNTQSFMRFYISENFKI